MSLLVYPKETDKQTDGGEHLPTPTDSIGVGKMVSAKPHICVWDQFNGCDRDAQTLQSDRVYSGSMNDTVIQWYSDRQIECVVQAVSLSASGCGLNISAVLFS